MRQGANGEGILVERAGIAEQARHKIAAAHVVSKIAEEDFSKRIIPHVLHSRAAIRKGMRNHQLSVRGFRKLGEQQRPDRVVPCQVDQLFMGENGICRAIGSQQNCCQEQNNRVASVQFHSALRWVKRTRLLWPETTRTVCGIPCKTVYFCEFPSSLRLAVRALR